MSELFFYCKRCVRMNKREELERIEKKAHSDLFGDTFFYGYICKCGNEELTIISPKVD